ncbi:hypothetical protein [Fodinicola feengrottensis]|uniref:hypothetical protein n=1 Tax=Fodinicola feengrottensis TaxID=435914 RepID=UPI0013D66632|nr:hypothetical protein [Fodinicola feengrottensis]
MKIQAEPTADLGALRDRIETAAIAHVREALETDLPARVEFTVGASSRQRVA